MNTLETTAASILTPPGRGAVAVIAVTGPAAMQVVAPFFRTQSKPLAERPFNRIAYGRWGSEPAEDVVACRRSDTSIEIHCHGGAAAVKRILGDLTGTGASEITWQEFVRQSGGDSIRTAAVVALSGAVTERTAAILLDQYQGALASAIQQIADQLASGQLAPTKLAFEELLARGTLGLHLTQPWQVVIAGPPNVGKSSLINALLGYQRAIVFDQPGTTRDVVTASTAFDGWPVQLSDTAGLRATDNALETAGIERAMAQAAAADCLLLVFDASQPWSAENDRLIQRWPGALVVHNKCDLAVAARPGIATSALNGQGINCLINTVVAKLVPEAPSPGQAIPFTASQIEILQTALAEVEQNRAEVALAALKAALGNEKAHTRA